MPSEDYLFTSRFNTPAGTVERFERWCDRRHFPDLLDAGFHSAATFKSVQGEPEYLHLFEIPDLDVFASPAFGNLCICDPPCPRPGCLAKQDPGRPGAQAMADCFLDSSRAVYESFVTTPASSPSPTLAKQEAASAGLAGSSCLFTARMDLDPSMEEQYLRWQERDVFPELASIPGFVSGRIGRRVDNFEPDELHRHVAAEPTYMVMWEVESPEVYREDNPRLAAARARPEAARMRQAVRRNLINLSVRIGAQ